MIKQTTGWRILLIIISLILVSCANRHISPLASPSNDSVKDVIVPGGVNLPPENPSNSSALDNSVRNVTISNNISVQNETISNSTGNETSVASVPNIIFRPEANWTRSRTNDPICAYTGQYLPVVYYHDIELNTTSGQNTAYDQFLAQTRYFYEKGYDTITLDKAYAYMHNQTCVNRASVVVIFDDAFIGVYRYAYPLYKRLGFVGVLALRTDSMQSKGRMNYSVARQLADEGWEVASHSHNHLNLLNSTPDVREVEFAKSKQLIEANTGLIVKDFVTPFNFIGNDSLTQCKQHYQLCTGLGHSEAWDCKYFESDPINRYIIHVGTNFTKMEQRIETCLGIQNS